MAARLGRRGFVGGAAALSAAAWPGRTHAARAMGFDEARHLLSRAGFGATPDEIGAFETLDYAVAVDRLLGRFRPRADTPAPGWVDQRPTSLSVQQKGAQARLGPDGKPLRVGQIGGEQARELRNWWIEEMLATDQPLVERMTLFWHTHFASSFLKVRYVPALYRQNVLFRREALGSFATLLRDVARDPAMLIYLDGVGSMVRQPNENFARELLELFTLGEGRYGEADVKAAARAFTGWTIDRQTGHFRVATELHDAGEKTFLGQTGRFGGHDVIDILLRHPRTAETIVEKLWREFVSLKPDPAEVGRLAAVFRGSGYEVKPLLRALFHSPAFRDPANRGALIKSPADLIVGTVRVLGLPVAEKTQLARMMQGLGQRLFDPPNVNGWPGGESWITAYTLLLRQQFMRRIVEATTVSPMEAGGMTAAPSTARREMMPPPAQEMLPVEGRSLRNAAGEARLGPTLDGIDADTLVRTLLPLRPVDAIDTAGRPGAVVAAALLDTAYQLK